LTSSKTILAFVGLGFAGACSDSISAPTSEVSARIPAAYTQVLGVSTIKYTPRKGLTARLGDHVLVIPAGGICDPATSSYGPGTWDLPCDAVTHSVIITATTYADADGHPYLEFSPALRFVPTKETNLYLKDGKRTNATIVTINYCSPLGCIDESKTDESLVTHRIGNSRILVRRIKHFSGYNVAAGEPCPGTIIDDPEGGLWCELDDLRGNLRSGYMVASGLGQTGGNPGIRRKKYDK
jgi:hypothetical protein